VEVRVSKNDQLGQFLVDNKGMTLYTFTQDSKNTSNCYDQCAAAWPPLYTSGAAMANPGVDASLLGSTTRKDGKTQVTYNGRPLYYWSKDQKPGDTSGQNIGGVWFVISPKGEAVQTKAGAAQGTAMTAMPGTPASSNQAAPGKALATAAPPAAAGGQATGQTVKVDIMNFAFSPKVLTVAPGTTVLWTNNDSTAHTVTADNGGFDSGNLGPGASFRFTFAKAGTFAYYCRYHGGPGGTGMAGQVVVK
jgi:predicted lipoprotein with Yx(FWY)xxD motif/plastocyanin